MTTTSPPEPTGRLVPAPDADDNDNHDGPAYDLVLTRTLPGSLADAWASVTEPDRTARWFGRWEGVGAVGETIRIRLGFEEGTPWTEARIAECAAPHRLRVVTVDDAGSWDLAIDLAPSEEVPDRTELRFVMHRVDPATVGEVGPGWEYYLDQLLAVLTGADLPDFGDYFPAQRAYYAAQGAAV
ncbi:SRPBCC domain-containing protein [Pimelobacter simplex]|uniref:SRPBCC domain-containing protein n=1 Tax=Nocardioides simplex TaxID=2045 RepID=UPI003AAFECC9